MTSRDVIQTYEAILEVTAQMLDAARGANWDQLAEREKQCRTLVEKLAAAQASPVLDEDARRRKAQIIRKVLSDDAAIRDLTQPWMARLQHMLTSAGHERRLHAAYGRPD